MVYISALLPLSLLCCKYTILMVPAEVSASQLQARGHRYQHMCANILRTADVTVTNVLRPPLLSNKWRGHISLSNCLYTSLLPSLPLLTGVNSHPFYPFILPVCSPQHRCFPLPLTVPLALTPTLF